MRNGVFALGALAMACSTQMQAAELILPDVEPCNADIQLALSGGLNNLQCINGGMTYVASYHDEFLSYSIEALELIQKETNLLPTDIYGDWSKLQAGSGTLDVGVLVKAPGGGVLNNDPPFPDAQDSNTTDPIYERTWGGDTGTDTSQGPTDPGGDPILTVEEVVQWLAPESIPVFYFDLADPQNAQDADLFFSGQVVVTDANGEVGPDGTITGNVLDVWAFDNLFNGDYDESAAVLAPKNVPVFIPGSGCNDFPALGVDYCNITNSRGSGKAEFVAYAPSMNLAQYAENGNLFWGNFTISATGAADEEIFLTKRIGPTDVPAPAALSLLGIGLLGMGWLRRRRQS